MKASRLRTVFRLWPPFICSGIRVEHIADDFSQARVRLRRRWFNRNYVGTHFGGSLFAMTDPFWMILVMRQLGDDYIVWDQAAEIVFVAPGRTDVVAEFKIDPADIEALRHAAAGGDKVLRWFETDVRDVQGKLIARVRKQLYVRLKRSRTADSALRATASGG